MIHWQPWGENYQLAVLGYMIWAEIYINPKDYGSADKISKMIALNLYNCGKQENLRQSMVLKSNIEERISHFKEYIEKISMAFIVPESHMKYR